MSIFFVFWAFQMGFFRWLRCSHVAMVEVVEAQLFFPSLMHYGREEDPSISFQPQSKKKRSNKIGVTENKRNASGREKCACMSLGIFPFILSLSITFCIFLLSNRQILVWGLIFLFALTLFCRSLISKKACTRKLMS